MLARFGDAELIVEVVDWVWAGVEAMINEKTISAVVTVKIRGIRCSKCIRGIRTTVFDMAAF